MIKDIAGKKFFIPLNSLKGLLLVNAELISQQELLMLIKRLSDLMLAIDKDII